MSKDQLIRKIAKEFSVDEIAVAEFVEAIFDALALTLSKGKNVTISEFGRFRIQKKREGERLTKKLIFTPVKKVADQINKNYNNLPIVKLRVVDSKSRDSIPEVSEKEFIYIMEDEVIISADIFEGTEFTPPSTSSSEIPTSSLQEKDLQDTRTIPTKLEETVDTAQKATVISGLELSEEMHTQDKELPSIKKSLLSDTGEESDLPPFELKEVVEERQKLLDEITELEKREKELSTPAILEKLSKYNVDNFDVSEKTILDNNELIALIGEAQNIFLIKEDITPPQQSQITHIDAPLTFTKDEISDELKILEEEISNLPSIDRLPETKETQPLKESDKSTKIEATELFENSISSLQEAFEEIKINKQTEENLSLTESNKTKDLGDSPFKPIDYTPTTTQEVSKSQTATTMPLDEIREKKALNPYLKLTIVFLLIFLLLILAAILF
ncbi:MAG: HU family DNA-binding protein [Ignavibacteria bacterium]